MLAILDDGVIALGPMVAGASGEVAGLMQLPLDLGAGTHELRLVGAASGAQPSEMFPVKAATAPTTPAAQADDDAETAARVFLGVAILVFLVALAGALVQLRRRRRQRPSAPTPTAPAAPATGAAS